MTAYFALPAVIDAAIAFLLGSCILGIVRIAVGPTAADRLTALNLSASQVLALLVLTAIRTEAAVYLDVAMVYAVFGFIGILALTRYLGRNRSEEDS
jgi:multicomponent Na+:H+ antiporter subunit F